MCGVGWHFLTESVSPEGRGTGVMHQEGLPLGLCRVLLLPAPLAGSFTLENSLFLPPGSHHTRRVAAV